jgi:Glycosyltransferase family 87
MHANSSGGAVGGLNSGFTAKSRKDGPYIIFLGAAVVILLTLTVLLKPTASTMKDFRVVYFPARCLLSGLDPYNPENVMRAVQEAGQDGVITSAVDRDIQARYIYPPTAFLVTAPFAIMPWRAASVLWMLCGASGLILAAYLSWTLSEEFAPILSAILIAYLLANSEIIVVLGNPSGMAISLAVIGSWCLLKERYVWLGIVLLALSLALKPQDAGLIWCCFLLIGRAQRRNSLRVVTLLLVFAIPVLLWVWHVSPHWAGELHSNIKFLSARGGPADPGPSDKEFEFVNLQVVFSRIKDDSNFYDLFTWLVCGPLLLAWALISVRTRPSMRKCLLGLAAVVPLSLLPVYHRFYDARLLLLVIPACALLWASQRPIRWWALILTAAALVSTGDISHTLLNHLIVGLQARLGEGQTSADLPVFMAPTILLAMSVFYLWAFWRDSTTGNFTQPPKRANAEVNTTAAG